MNYLNSGTVTVCSAHLETVVEDPKLTNVIAKLADTDINLCLAAAHAAMDAGEFEDADRLFKRGLAWSEQRFGAQSSAVGLVLLAMIDLYEKDSLSRDTANLEHRLRCIYRRNFFRAVTQRLEEDEQWPV